MIFSTSAALARGDRECWPRTRPVEASIAIRVLLHNDRTIMPGLLSALPARFWRNFVLGGPSRPLLSATTKGLIRKSLRNVRPPPPISRLQQKNFSPTRRRGCPSLVRRAEVLKRPSLARRAEMQTP